MKIKHGIAYRTFGGERVVMHEPGESLWFHFNGKFDDGKERGYYDSGVPFAGERDEVIADEWDSGRPAYRPLTLEEMSAAFLQERMIRFGGEPRAILAVRRDRSFEIGTYASFTILDAEQLAKDAIWNDDETPCGVRVDEEVPA